MAEKVCSSPRFTVVIPTKNRAEYLAHTLKTCSAQDYDNLVVVVSDDGSTDGTREVVSAASVRDARIKFVSNGMSPGMRDNFEYALSLAEPGYVIALGSDDGLMPGGIQGMRDKLRESQAELLSWNAPLFVYAGVNDDRGQLILHHTKKDRLVQSREFLARQVAHLNYLGDAESPMTYVKGVASTRLIRQVQARSADGRFYQCPTPDGYSGIVLAGEVEQFAFSGTPYAIYGLSRSSQGLNYLANDDAAKKNSASFFRSVASVPMHRDLGEQPYSPLITLMTVDYLLTAKGLAGWPGVVPAIDFRHVLDAGIKELAHGLYGEERVRRELEILQRVAHHHDLLEYFNEKLRTVRRKRPKQPFCGTGISPRSIFLDASEYSIKDIFDASQAAAYLSKFYSELAPTKLFGHFQRSLGYALSSRGEGGVFADIWNGGGS